MTPESASWAGLAAGAPLVLVALCWSLLILHTHRPLWRAVDVFLAALLGQGCVRQLLTLGLALLQLLGAPQAAQGIACSTAVWSLTALHALHAATLASLVLDRALSLRWPRRYKRHPRRDHARYHVCVLTVISGFVGLAAVFARPSNSVSVGKCAFLPHELEPRFALFAATLHGVLAVSTLVGCLVVEVRRRRRPSLLRSTSDLRALAPPNQSDTSTASTASGRGRSSSDSSILGGKPAHISGYDTSGNARYCSDTESSILGAAKQGYGSSLLLTGPYTTWHEPLTKKISLPERLRWSTVVAVLALCYFLHHLPVLAVIIIGSLDPAMLPPWPLDSLALWVGLAQDCLLPICLVLCDANFGPWVARVYRRQGRPSPEDKTAPPMFPGLMSELKPNPGRLFAPDPLEGKIPLSNGSLFTTGSAVMNNYQIGRGVVRYSRAACMGLAAREIRGYLSHNAPDNATNNVNPMSSSTWVIKPAANQQNIEMNQNQRHLRPDNAPPPPPQFATQNVRNKNDSDSEEECDEEPIYATLSDEVGTLSSLGEDIASRCCSVTTAANDDFVFHRGPQRSNYSDSTSSAQTSEDEIKRPEIIIEPRRPRIRPRFYHSNSKILDSSSDEDDNDDIMNEIKNFTDDDDDIIKEQIIKIKRQSSNITNNKNNNNKKIERKVSRNHSRSSNSTKMPSSFSMNDLDRLDIGYHHQSSPVKNHHHHHHHHNNKNNYLQDENGDLEVVFELPVKSESILSLYRLPFGNEIVRGPADPSRHEQITVRKPSFNRQDQFARRPQPRHIQSSRQEQARHSLGAVLSMDSLHSALARDVSYLDSGELCRHGTSFPDLQRVFVSDYL